MKSPCYYLCCYHKVRKYSVNHMRLLLTSSVILFARVWKVIERNERVLQKRKWQVMSEGNRTKTYYLQSYIFFSHWINQVREMNCPFAFQICKYVISAHLTVPAVPGYKSGKDHIT